MQFKLFLEPRKFVGGTQIEQSQFHFHVSFVRKLDFKQEISTSLNVSIKVSIKSRFVHAKKNPLKL